MYVDSKQIINFCCTNNVIANLSSFSCKLVTDRLNPYRCPDTILIAVPTQSLSLSRHTKITLKTETDCNLSQNWTHFGKNH